MGKNCEVVGVVELVRALKGPAFKDVNRALRAAARPIADDMIPHVSLAVSMSAAPQSAAFVKTVRSKPDRVPVVVIGKTNPRFSSPFTRRGSGDSARRRGSMAHGIVYGPAGGRRDTPATENYYRIPRDDSGGPLGRALQPGGAIVRQAETAYLAAFVAVLRSYGLDAHT